MMSQISDTRMANAIVWAVMSDPAIAALLHAYNPANLGIWEIMSSSGAFESQ
jgi:hypothetical protein